MTAQGGNPLPIDFGGIDDPATAQWRYMNALLAPIGKLDESPSPGGSGERDGERARGGGRDADRFTRSRQDADATDFTRLRATLQRIAHANKVAAAQEEQAVEAEAGPAVVSNAPAASARPAVASFGWGTAVSYGGGQVTGDAGTAGPS